MNKIINQIIEEKNYFDLFMSELSSIVLLSAATLSYDIWTMLI